MTVPLGHDVAGLTAGLGRAEVEARVFRGGVWLLVPACVMTAGAREGRA